MKRKLCAFMAFMMSMSMVLVSVPKSFAQSVNSIESVKTATSTGTVDITFKIMGEDGIGAKEGITAGDIFYLNTGNDTEIRSTNGEEDGTWETGQTKHPKKVYVRVGANFVPLTDDGKKVDLKNYLQKMNVNVDGKDTVFDFGKNPLTFEKTSDSKITVSAMSKEDINLALDNFFSKLGLNENLVKQIKDSDTLKQFSVAMDLKIKFHGASGTQGISIDPGSSTVTGTTQNSNSSSSSSSSSDVQVRPSKDVEIYFVTSKISDQGKNLVPFKLTGGKDAFIKDREIKLILPDGFIWNGKLIDSKFADIEIDSEKPQILTVRFLGNSTKDSDFLEFVSGVKPQKDAKEGEITIKVEAEGDKKGEMKIAVYKKEDKKPEARKIKTVFTMGKDSYIIDDDMVKKMDAKPYAKNSRIMLPIRYVAESIGVKVDYDPKENAAIFTQGEKVVIAKYQDRDTITVNGEKQKLYAPMNAIDSRLYLPLASIAEAFGLKHGQDIIWNQDEKTVTIYSTVSK